MHEMPVAGDVHICQLDLIRAATSLLQDIDHAVIVGSMHARLTYLTKIRYTRDLW